MSGDLPTRHQSLALFPADVAGAVSDVASVAVDDNCLHSEQNSDFDLRFNTVT